MSTLLYVLSDISVSTVDILNRKAWYLQQLKNLLTDTEMYPRYDDSDPYLHSYYWKDEYCEQGYYTLPSKNSSKEDFIFTGNELISFSTWLPWQVDVYDNCILLSGDNKYSFLYTDFSGEESCFTFFDFEFDYEEFHQEVWLFRKRIFDIISIFGGTEVVFLSDGSCRNLHNYLCLVEEEGASFSEVKKLMKKDGLPLVKDYSLLDYNKLRYDNITEYVYDDFSDFKNI